MITDSSGTYYQTTNTYTMKYSDVTISAEFTPENEPPTFRAMAMPVKINQAVSAGALIKGLSGIRASITNAAAADPKTIAGYRINIPGYGSSTSQTYTTGAFTSSGTVSIEYTVTDSNGNSTTKWIYVNVLNYNEPGASISFARCGDAQMSDDPLGIYVKYKVTPYYTDVDSNYIQSVTLLISGTSTAKTLVADGNWHVIDNYTIIPENSVSTTLTVTDKFTSVSSTEIIPSANYAIYMSSDGTSIGFGKATTHQNSFEIAPSRTVYVGWNTAQNEQYTLDEYIAKKAGDEVDADYVVT